MSQSKLKSANAKRKTPTIIAIFGAAVAGWALVICCGGLYSIGTDDSDNDQTASSDNTAESQPYSQDDRLTRSLRDYLSSSGWKGTSWHGSVGSVLVRRNGYVTICMPNVYPDADADRLANSVTGAVFGWANDRRYGRNIKQVSVIAGGTSLESGGTLVSIRKNPIR